MIMVYSSWPALLAWLSPILALNHDGEFVEDTCQYDFDFLNGPSQGTVVPQVVGPRRVRSESRSFYDEVVTNGDGFLDGSAFVEAQAESYIESGSESSFLQPQSVCATNARKAKAVISALEPNAMNLAPLNEGTYGIIMSGQIRQTDNSAIDVAFKVLFDYTGKHPTTPLQADQNTNEIHMLDIFAGFPAVGQKLGEYRKVWTDLFKVGENFIC